MTTGQTVFRAKVGLLELGMTPSMPDHGVQRRETFYPFKEPYDPGGEEL